MPASNFLRVFVAPESVRKINKTALNCAELQPQKAADMAPSAVQGTEPDMLRTAGLIPIRGVVPAAMDHHVGR